MSAGQKKYHERRTDEMVAAIICMAGRYREPSKKHPGVTYSTVSMKELADKLNRHKLYRTLGTYTAGMCSRIVRRTFGNERSYTEGMPPDNAAEVAIMFDNGGWRPKGDNYTKSCPPPGNAERVTATVPAEPLEHLRAMLDPHVSTAAFDEFLKDYQRTQASVARIESVFDYLHPGWKSVDWTKLAKAAPNAG